VLWAHAKVERAAPDLFEAMSKYLLSSSVLSEITPQGLGNIAWAYAKQALLHASPSPPADALPPADGRLGVYLATDSIGGVKELFRAIASRVVESDLESFSGQDVSNLVYAFSVLGLFHEPLYRALGDEVARRYRESGELSLNYQEIVNLLWSFASCNYRHPQLLESVSGYLSSHFSSLPHKSKTESANLLWSFVVLNMHMEDAARPLIDAIWRHCQEGEGELPKRSVMSLVQVQLAVQEEAHADWSLEFGEGVITHHNSPTLNLNKSKFQGAVFAETKKSFVKSERELLAEEYVDPASERARERAKRARRRR
jgi:hypothetical protein